MKYKKGDKVRIKTWDDLAATWGVDEDSDIAINPCFAVGMENCLQEKIPSRIVTIESVGNHGGKYDFYILEKTGKWHWTDLMIEDRSKELVEEAIVKNNKSLMTDRLTFIDLE